VIFFFFTLVSSFFHSRQRKNDGPGKEAEGKAWADFIILIPNLLLRKHFYSAKLLLAAARWSLRKMVLVPKLQLGADKKVGCALFCTALLYFLINFFSFIDLG
jgi:hypothetical protein